jgi:outer membrane protein assembly factor BamB
MNANRGITRRWKLATTGFLGLGLVASACRDGVTPISSPAPPRASAVADPTIGDSTDFFSGWGVPAVDGTAAYFLTPDHQMMAVDRTGGRELARYTLYAGGADYPGLVAIRAGPMVAAIDNGVLFAFAPVGAPPRSWTYRPPSGGLEDWITADATTIYAGSSDGRLYAVDAASGTLRWVTVVSAESEAQARAPRVRGGASRRWMRPPERCVGCAP